MKLISNPASELLDYPLREDREIDIKAHRILKSIRVMISYSLLLQKMRMINLIKNPKKATNSQKFNKILELFIESELSGKEIRKATIHKKNLEQ